MTSILDLPEELLQLMLGNFAEHRRSLAAVCLINKQFNRLAEPIMYHTIDLNGLSDHCITQLAERFAQSPPIARLVREFRIPGWDFRDPDGNIGQEEAAYLAQRDRNRVPFPPVVRQHLSDAAQPLRSVLGQDVLNRLVARMVDGDEDALLAFVISQCPGLTLLELTLPYNFPASWVALVLKHLAPISVTDSNTPSLSNIRQLSVNHWDTEGTSDIADVREIMRLPSLNVFTAWAICLAEEMPLGMARQASDLAYNIKEVELLWSIVEAPGISWLLSCCPKLEKLYIEWGASVAGDCEILYDEIGDALRLHGKQLKHVTLRPDNAFSVEYREEPEYLGLGSLKTLTHLDHLSVPASALVGGRDDEEQEEGGVEDVQELIDILPESLKNLEISREQKICSLETFGYNLLGLMQSDQFQVLATVKVHDVSQYIGRNCSELNELLQMFLDDRARLEECDWTHFTRFENGWIWERKSVGDKRA